MVINKIEYINPELPKLFIESPTIIGPKNSPKDIDIIKHPEHKSVISFFCV